MEFKCDVEKEDYLTINTNGASNDGLLGIDTFDRKGNNIGICLKSEQVEKLIAELQAGLAKMKG